MCAYNGYEFWWFTLLLWLYNGLVACLLSGGFGWVGFAVVLVCGFFGVWFALCLAFRFVFVWCLSWFLVGWLVVI